MEYIVNRETKLSIDDSEQSSLDIFLIVSLYKSIILPVIGSGASSVTILSSTERIGLISAAVPV